MKQEVKYYRRIKGNSSACKLNHIYPDTYEGKNGSNVKNNVSTFPELWQEVSEETYKVWAKDMVKELFPVGSKIKSLINSDAYIENNRIDIVFDFISISGWNVYNLKTCEWAEIVSKPEEEKEESELPKILDHKNWNNAAEYLAKNNVDYEDALKNVMDLFNDLKSIPEAKKVLVKRGFIERDYVSEVFARDASFEDFRNCVENDMLEPYDRLPTKDICRYIVEGLERDEKNNQLNKTNHD